MREVLRDLRYALRSFRRSPAFFLVAVLTLSVGIGANTALFSVIREVLLRPLPYPAPGHLVALGGDARALGSQDLLSSSAEYRDYASRATTLQGIAAGWPINANLTSGVEPERVRVALVTTNFFTVLGRSPVLGRGFTPEDAAGELGYAAVLSHEAWERLFNSAPTAIGATIRLDDDPMTVIGVMPPDFEQPGEARADRVSVWVPVDLRAGNRLDRRTPRNLTVIGRLRTGVSLAACRGEFEGISAAIRREYPDAYPEEMGWAVRVESLSERSIGDTRPAFRLLLAAVGLVLLAVCANMASLLLARGQNRGREMAIRVAMGGGWSRILRQLLTETLVLVGAGWVGGMGVAALGLRLFHGTALNTLPRVAEPSLDGLVLGFGFLLSLFAGIVFGLFPSLRAARSEPEQLLRQGRFGAARRARAREALTVAQVAISFVLVAGGGLLTRSLVRLLSMDPGFDPHGVLAVQTWLPIPNEPANARFREIPDRVAFVDNALLALRENPAVENVAIASLVPLRGSAPRGFRVEGDEQQQGEELQSAEYRQVSPEYFDVMGIPLIQGRAFRDSDDAGAPRVAVVDRSLADRWLGEDPVGRRIVVVGSGTVPWEIVGVVGDVRDESLRAVLRPHVYVNYRQSVGMNISFLLKTPGRPEALERFAGEAVRSIDPTQPVFGISSMEGVVASTLSRERLLALLLGSFGLMGLVLASVGVYGVISYSVGQRRQEIGIRIALGARPRGVLGMILKDGVRIAAVGIAIGSLLAAALSSLLSSVLFGVGRLDPATLLLALGVSVAVTLVASVVPANLAARLNPVEAIRNGRP